MTVFVLGGGDLRTEVKPISITSEEDEGQIVSTRGGWLRVDRHGERLQFVAETKLSSSWGLVQCRHDVPVVPAEGLI